ncbi:ATP-binding protein [Gracilibacillus marinus]|uniref:histidine kinase n=1 Tax=Gracilibacillus marinus TaxID=630535 RepID=A0ABV8VRR3_9BACI
MTGNKEQVTIKDGILDLRGNAIWEESIVSLDGDWLFHPNQLLTKVDESKNEQLIKVPSKWGDYQTEKEPSIFYGTYQLTILVDKGINEPFIIVVPSVRNASEVYINGNKISQSGTVAAEEKYYTPMNVPTLTTFTATDNGVIEVLIQVANYLDPYDAGIIRSVEFGTSSTIRVETLLSYSMQLIVMIAFLIYAIYSFALFLIHEHNKNYLYTFFILFFAIVIQSLGSHEKILTFWLQLNFEWNIRLANIGAIGLSIGLYLIAKVGYKISNKLWSHGFYAVCISMLLLTIFLPLQWLQYIADACNFILISTCFYAIIQLIKSIREEFFVADIWKMLAVVALFHNFIWWGIWIEQGIRVAFYPIDLVVTIACFTMMWLHRYVNLYRKSLEQAESLANVAKEKDSFLANTSHELRNPLHSMLQLTEVVLDRNKNQLDERATKELRTVLHVGNRMSILLDDLLDLARLKLTKPKIQYQSFYLQAIVPGIMDMFEVMIDKKRVQLKNEIPEDLPPVYADENRVLQVIYNIFHNAVKFTDYGWIKLKATIDDRKIVVTIMDTGVGMDQSTFFRVFEPYEQDESMSYLSEGGVGLGLSISKQLIELHGEKLYGRSKKGLGTELSFTLQISDHTPTKEVKVIEKPQLNDRDVMEEEAHASILIVDDDLVNLYVLESILSKENYQVTAISDSNRALEHLFQKEWDLVILDVMMPNLSGYELTKEIRERYSKTELPVLLLTALSHSKDMEVGFHAGANDYVVKPVDSTELLARVYNLVQMKRLTKQQVEMEAMWLHAQIQPHFIFNTLNTINALSVFKPDKMRGLIERFSEILRKKFDFASHHQFIPIKEELQIVEDYLYIEKVRYGDLLTIKWNVHDTKNYVIPILTIQPIVENAIKHGIMRQQKGGSLEIKTVKRNGILQIIVKDNGIGMSKEILAQLQSGKWTNGRGIGLWNTNKRWKQLFGKELRIRSLEGIGTVVVYRIEEVNDRRGGYDASNIDR